jgi:hypothetical protein
VGIVVIRLFLCMGGDPQTPPRPSATIACKWRPAVVQPPADADADLQVARHEIVDAGG